MAEELRKEILQKSRYPSEWERLFEFWSQPPSQTEQDQCSRTIREISEAIRFNPRLSSKDISIFAQGSFANRVNVRQESDVDVCVRLNELIMVSYPPGVSNIDVGLVDVSYTYSQFKDDVEAALVARFKRDKVSRGDKAFDVHSLNYLVDADVVATSVYRRYFRSNGEIRYHEGTALKTERENKRLTNFPNHQLENGKDKNERTKRRFRQQVRILKTIRYNMGKWSVPSAAKVSSFGLESLCWGAPDSIYLAASTHHERLVALCTWMHENLSEPIKAKHLMEINGLKLFFGSHNSVTAISYSKFIEDVFRTVSKQS